MDLQMITNGKSYSRIFSQLCHMVALNNEGQLKAAIEGLIMSTLVLDNDLLPSGPQELIEAIDRNYAVSLSEADVQKALSSLLSKGRLQKISGKYVMSPTAKAETQDRIEATKTLEQSVKRAWLDKVAHLFEGVHENWQESIWNCLLNYMAKAFHQH